MGEITGISWCDHTFNPWWGCQEVSEGCRNCYARTYASRMHPIKPLWGPPGSSERMRTKNPWSDAIKWNAKAKADGVRRRVFCASMADFFEDHPDLEPIRADAWELIDQCRNLDWLLLTKRPGNIEHMLSKIDYSHVWFGTTVENQSTLWRFETLFDLAPLVSLRFVSYEPALGPIDWTAIEARPDWIIYGGESGPNHRPADPQWARATRDFCRVEGIAFFHKQSHGPRSGMGIELDGEIIQEFPR